MDSNFISRLEVNRVLYTKNGRLTGNALIVEVKTPGLPRLFDPKTYVIKTDYGNVLSEVRADQIDNQFTLGPVADSSHKNYVQLKVENLVWQDVVKFVESKTGLKDLSTEQALGQIMASKERYTTQFVADHLPSGALVWRQGEVVPKPVKQWHPKPSSSGARPFLKGDERDYIP